MSDEQLNDAAARLAAGRLTLAALDALPATLRPADAATAYRIQRRLHQRYRDAGRAAVAGYKIGCTTPVMQEYLGIDHPCAGGVLADTVHHGQARLRHADFRRVGVECEIAVRLCADLPPRPGGYTPETVAPAVGEVMAAIEIVDDRWQDFTTVDAFTLIADDFFGAGCVLGDAHAFDAGRDLAALGGSMAINGAVVGEGRASDILGHPLNALAWLAGSGAAADGLRRDQIVLLGSVVKTHWLAPGDRVEVRIQDLGMAGLQLT